MTRRDWRRSRITIAIGSVLLVASGLASCTSDAASRPSDPTSTRNASAASEPEVAPDPTALVSGDASTDWWEQFGPEPPPPAVPDGWAVRDTATFRFAVPSVWPAPTPDACTVPQAGVVLIPLMFEFRKICGGPHDERTDSLTIRTTASGTEPVIGPEPGSFERTRIVEATCDACVRTDRFDSGYDATATGVSAERILTTFTPSGAQRVLLDGPVADTTGWQTLSFRGVEVLIPEEWSVLDLDESYTITHNSDGSISESGFPNPGECGQSLFTSGDTNIGYVGDMGFIGSCITSVGVIDEYDIAPHDGVWLRPPPADVLALEQTPLAEGSVDSMEIRVVSFDQTDHFAPTSTLDLTVRTGRSAVEMSLGVGEDTSIARAILRSLRRAEES